MATALEFAMGLATRGRGISLLLWEDKDDLIRALLVLQAALTPPGLEPKVCRTETETTQALFQLFERQRVEPGEALHDTAPSAHSIPILFVAFASGMIVGPVLNGWRRQLADPPGSIIVLRCAESRGFARCAPDLASFVQTKGKAEEFLPIWPRELHDAIRPRLNEGMMEAICSLPGEAPSESELAHWKELHTPGGEASK